VPAIGVLALVLLAYAALLALWALVAAILRRPRGPAHAVGLVLLELGLVVQAVVRALGVAAGDQPARPAAHVGYLAASVVLLPLLLGILRPGGGGGRAGARTRGTPASWRPRASW
jgi:hypothetical protein